MFVGKARSLPKSGAILRWALPLLANIRLGRKGLPGYNTPAFTCVKAFFKGPRFCHLRLWLVAHGIHTIGPIIQGAGFKAHPETARVARI